MKTSISLLATLLSGTSAVAQVTPKQFAPGAAFVNLGYALTAPASSSATCSPGQQSYDGTYVYLCTATNTWGRALTSDFSGNVNLPGALTLGTALSVANGGTGAATAQAARLSLGAPGMGVYSLADYCTGSCTTTAQQTAAFTTIAGLINGAGGVGSLWIPPGSWRFDTTLAGGPMVFPNLGASIIGPGANTATVTVTGGSFAQWTHGYGKISGFRIYEADNPASGVQIALTNTYGMDVSDLQLGGGCVDLELASSTNTHVTNLAIIGDNSSGSCAPTSVATGVTGLLVHRSSSGAVHSTANMFTNVQIRASSARSMMKNAIVVSSSDGLNLTSVHAGITSGDALLAQPEYASDKIDNVYSTGVDYDTSSIGVHFLPFAGTFTGHVGENTFTGGMAEINDNEGVRVDDPAAINLSFTGVSLLLNGKAGINIQAGTNATVTGNTYSQNNASNAGEPNLRIGGTSSNTSVSGGAYRGGGATPIPYHVVVADSADYVSIGAATYSGAVTGNFSNTSSGTHSRPPAPSVSDISPAEWPSMTVAGGSWYLNALNNLPVAQVVTGGTVNANFLILQGRAAGGTVSVNAGGAGGAATPIQFGSVTGATTLGYAAGTVAVPAPTTVSNTLAVTGASTLAAVSETSRTLTALAESTTAPTIASGFCTSPSVGADANGTLVFRIVIGSACASSTGTLTMPAATHGWRCNFSDLTTQTNKPDMAGDTATTVLVQNYSRTTGAATNWTAGDVIQTDCHGF